MDLEEPNVIKEWVREKNLGSGAFGIVTLWHNTKTGEKIAIKKCRFGIDTNLNYKLKERWCKEVDIMKQIRNENVVAFKKLPDALEAQLQKYNPHNLPMLSMEYCTKGDLRQVLNRQENCCGLLEADCRNILSDIKNALEHLHSLNITHRDLKPENIVLQYAPNRYNNIIYKLIDLGYAKEIGGIENNVVTFVGTLQYLAPELMYGKSYSSSSDFWSFGVLAFEVMCGIRPFLPKYSPGQWLDLMKDKSSENICVYETLLDKNIKYSNHMFSENHLTKIFKINIEPWLIIVLEWDPKKRGLNEKNQLVIYKMLDDILNKMIISVFSVLTYEFLSYEIQTTTTFEELQKWLEQDTKILIDEQIILTYNSDSISKEQLVKSYYINFFDGPLFYLFQKNKIIEYNKNLIPRLSIDVKTILDNAPKLFSYEHRKRANAIGLYFVYQETKLYNTLIESCTIKINNLIKQFETALKTVTIMKDLFNNLKAQIEFSRCLNEMNNNFQTDSIQYKSLISNYLEKYNSFTKRFNKLREATKSIATRFESARRRCFKMNNEFVELFSKDKEHDLNLTLEQALDCYANIKNTPKDERGKLKNCSTIVKIICLCLKQRDKLLKDKTLYENMQKIIYTSNEYEKITVPLELAINHIYKFKNEHLQMQLKNQIDILTECSKRNSINKINDFEQIKDNDSYGNSRLSIPSEFINEYLDSRRNSSISSDGYEGNLKFLQSLDLESLQNDTKQIIEESEKVKKMFKEKTEENLNEFKKILEEKIDFSFLAPDLIQNVDKT